MEVDYSDINGKKFDAMSAADFISMVSSDGMLGSPLLRTQHLIGASKWKKSSDAEVIAYHQLQSSQTRYENVGSKVIKDESTRRVTIRHTFRKINGTWKLEGIKPSLCWDRSVPET
ncbi:putative scytalone dehydratase [Talaromyces pinophilus]|nr:putative scytalone dehydratase [Talaromyces pinophilus]